MAAGKKPGSLKLKAEPGDQVATGPKAAARAILRPTVQGGMTIREVTQNTVGEIDLAELINALSDQARAITRDNNMDRPEAMLMTQASTLDAVFNALARRATANMGQHLQATDTYWRLALKAQAQCRATLEALAEIRNPRPVAFVKQTNISGGHQQVNNGTVPQSGPVHASLHAHARQNVSSQNELLEAHHGIELDTRAQSTSGGADPQVETVAAGYRSAHT